jgi:CRISPR-associated protein Csb1
MKTLDLELLNQACSGYGAALRIRTKLLPVGGSDDKIFPPTYAGENHAVYAVEKRRIGEREVATVLLDSVQSQANRMEQGLLQAVEDQDLQIPVIEVNFASAFEGRKKVTSLDAPHRIADALIRDSLVIDENKTPFAKSTIGKRFTASNYADATALFEYCPTALIFGVWDSHGSGGGLGNKFARALVSEIVGFDSVAGVRTGGKLDPFNIGSKIEGRIYEHKDHDEKWTFDEADAAKDKKGKLVVAGKDPQEKGKPSAIGHGNIPPSVVEFKDKKRDSEAEPYSGGVTISSALQTTVLSFPQLRRLRFPAEDGTTSAVRNKAGRVVLAALALHAIALQKSDGYLLRSRSQLVPVPKEPSKIEFVDENGKAEEIDAESLSVKTTKALLDAAVAAASSEKLTWRSRPVKMEPSPKLLKLLELSQTGRGEAEDTAL